MPKNTFTAPKKLINGKRPYVREHCKTFHMSTDNEDDQMFLAHLYRTIWIHGGEITINDGTVKETYRFLENAE